jgi:di/tricarboxylate transporter
MAAQKLKEMGPISRNEWLMLLAFFILLAFGSLEEHFLLMLLQQLSSD